MKLPNGWKIELLGDFMLVRDGVHQTPTYTESGVPFLRVTDIQEDIIDLSRTKYISQKEHEKITARLKAKSGDILYSKNGTIGITKIINWDWEFSFFVSLALLKFKKNGYSVHYVAQYLQSNLAKKEIYKGSKQGSVINLHLEEIQKFSVPIPPLREQCRIAEILGVWDESIDLLEKLIAAKRKLKQGLMQRLLTGKKRFKEFQESENSIVKISEVAKIRRGASPRPIQDPKWFAETGRGWVRIRDVTASDTYLMRTSQYLSDLAIEKSVKVDPGDLIMSICATIGVPRIVGIPACIHDGFVVFREFENQINKFFLYHYINFISSRISDSGQPGTQKNINTTIVGNIEIPKFSMEEQEKIASILSTADDEISTLEKELAAYKEQKRGLMQQLLTGRTRILGLEDGQD